jgi:hypothetical protein
MQQLKKTTVDSFTIIYRNRKYNTRKLFGSGVELLVSTVFQFVYKENHDTKNPETNT